MGWGGVGMMTYIALAHMWDATQLMGMMTYLALAHMWDATQLMGWGWWRILHLHTCEMLRYWWGGDDDAPHSLGGTVVEVPLETFFTSWTCCEHEKTADCQPLHFSTSFKFATPTSVFEDTRIMWKNLWVLRHFLLNGHAQDFKMSILLR